MIKNSKKNIILIIVILLCPFTLFTEEIIYVAASQVQWPLTFIDGSGLSNDLIKLFNEIQSDYYFSFRAIPPKRLHLQIEKGIIHLAIFHNINWGWEKVKVNNSLDLLSTGDVYIALKIPGRDQAFFDNVGKVKMVGVAGFHYTYADFVSNIDILKKNYNTETVDDEIKVIRMIIKKRAQIGVVSLTLLNYIKAKDPDMYHKLLISDRFDSRYVRHFILSEKAPITIEEINTILKKLYQSGKLQQVYAKYGLTAPGYE